MKKLFTLIILASVCKLNAQSFHKGALVFDLGGGVEVYNTYVNAHYFVANKHDTTQEGKGANTHFTFGGEYGLHKNFGIGIRFKGNTWIQGKDTTGTAPSVKSNDILVQLNYHPVSTNKFDLVLGADVGYSKIDFYVNDKDKTHIWGSGSYISMYVLPRLYIGRFGFNMKLGLPFAKYKTLDTNNDQFNKDQKLGLKGIPGFNLSFGIQFRFLNPKEKTKEKEKPKESTEAPVK